MSLLLPLVAAMVFACEAPTHHDGDAIRCKGQGRSMRMYGIDAPEMPGSCRPGRDCTPGDPYAARDHLRSLTQGRSVRCEEKDIDSYGRQVVRCVADEIDLGCAMVADGYAVERYGRLDCNSPPMLAAAEDKAEAPIIRTEPGGETRYFAAPDAAPVPRRLHPAWLLGSLWFVLFNIIGWFAMDIDKSRALSTVSARVQRLPGSLILLVALFGGGPGVLAAQQILDHKLGEQPFSTLLLSITGLQIGLLAGIIGLAII